MEEDIGEIQRRFREVFNTEPTRHPLYQQMIRELKSGRRTKRSILDDLNEAATHRQREADAKPPGWRDENLST